MLAVSVLTFCKAHTLSYFLSDRKNLRQMLGLSDPLQTVEKKNPQLAHINGQGVIDISLLLPTKLRWRRKGKEGGRPAGYAQ